MYDQRPLETLASYLVAMIAGAVMYAGVKAYGAYTARKAVEATKDSGD